jgi:hypothetical protein
VVLKVCCDSTLQEHWQRIPLSDDTSASELPPYYGEPSALVVERYGSSKGGQPDKLSCLARCDHGLWRSNADARG